MCGMCPANGELENGDPEAPVDFLCRVAHLRAHAFGLAVAPHGECEYREGGERLPGAAGLAGAAARGNAVAGVRRRTLRHPAPARSVGTGGQRRRGRPRLSGGRRGPAANAGPAGPLAARPVAAAAPAEVP